MIVIRSRNVHDALPEGLRLLREIGVQRETRNGPALVAPEPVTTVYAEPAERVLFWATRDANPFFHFMEGLWMLGGRDDVRFVAHFAQNIAKYSDDGVRLNGAYGYRWRKYFGYDQLAEIAERLKKNKQDRQCVVAMWDGDADLRAETLDRPCNISIVFSCARNEQELDMTVYNRSNDSIWGAHGANAVHMSMLQEYMAGLIGVGVGKYWQVSNNFHAYLDTYQKCQDLSNTADYLPETRASLNPYVTEEVIPYPMMSEEPRVWDQDLTIFLEQGPIVGFRDRFFRRVATPIFHAWAAWKAKDLDGALEIIEQCAAEDWKKACREWLLRRVKL